MEGRTKVRERKKKKERNGEQNEVCLFVNRAVAIKLLIFDCFVYDICLQFNFINELLIFSWVHILFIRGGLDAEGVERIFISFFCGGMTHTHSNNRQVACSHHFFCTKSISQSRNIIFNL